MTNNEGKRKYRETLTVTDIVQCNAVSVGALPPTNLVEYLGNLINLNYVKYDNLIYFNIKILQIKFIFKLH